MVAEEVEASRLVVDDALVACDLFGIGEVGDSKVSVAGGKVLDREGGVAEDLDDRGW